MIIPGTHIKLSCARSKYLLYVHVYKTEASSMQPSVALQTRISSQLITQACLNHHVLGYSAALSVSLPIYLFTPVCHLTPHVSNHALPPWPMQAETLVASCKNSASETTSQTTAWNHTSSSGRPHRSWGNFVVAGNMG